MSEDVNRIHLSDEQWLDLAGAEGDAAARQHLAQCTDCAGELAGLRGAIEKFQLAARASADRPESHWLRQRTSVVSRALGRRAVPRLAWMAAAAVVTLTALSLVRQQPPAQPVPAVAAQVQQTQAESDSALLADVQRQVRRDVPEALQPAALLVEEMNQHANEIRNP
jgi:hypothetical protein